MERVQFRALYRAFWFRIVDLEVLSAHGDTAKLFGQVATILVTFSFIFAAPVAAIGPSGIPLSVAWHTEHSLISATMLTVGLFAVFSWDSAFPDRRDVLVLAPLPVRARTLFVAKIAALGMALGVSVLALNVFTGIAWPLLFIPAKAGLLGSLRSIAAYWITMGMAGVFLLGSVLAVQGVAAQLLSRSQFLRLSAFLQLAAFCLFLIVYFLEPTLDTPQALAAPENQRQLSWLPSYWFLGLFQQWNGSMRPEFEPLARRAWTGFAAAVLGTSVAFLLSYFRTLRKIVEEPDIVPRVRASHWSPRFGNLLETAVVLFSLRTLLRSRQHRLVLAFYLGVGFAIALFCLNIAAGQGTLVPRYGMPLPFLVSSIVMMGFTVMGVRIAFAIPISLQANWISA